MPYSSFLGRYRLPVGAIALLLGLMGCGGGGGGGGSSAASTTGTSGGSGTGGSGTGGGSGTTQWNQANPIDLLFEDYHYHGGQSDPVITFHLRIANHGTSAMEGPGAQWVIRDSSGQTVMSGTTPAFPAGAGMDIEQTYTGNTPGKNPYTYVIDPNNQYAETSKNNNVAEVIPDAPASVNWPIMGHELRWFDPHVHHFGTGLAFHCTIENIGTSGETVTNIPYRIRRDDGTIIYSGM